jgi:rfaE bifunctional protein kinase chain/domain
MRYLTDSINKFSEKRILVLGDVLLDKYIWGEVKRSNPDDPTVPLVNFISETHILGGAANVANNISSLGAETYLISLIGKDNNGKIIKNLCSEKKINFFPFYGKNPTIVKERVMARGKPVVRLDFGEENLKKIDFENQNKICECINPLINSKNFDAVILSDYNKLFFVEEFTQKIINLFNEKRIKVLADPKPNNINLFRNCYLVSPNLKEAEEITKIKYSSGESLKDISVNLSNILNSRRIIITCGEKGVFGYNKSNGDFYFKESQAKEVSDQTGAGDTFIAAYTLAEVSGFSFEDSLKIANSAAAVVVGKIGTATISSKELLESLNQQKPL